MSHDKKIILNRRDLLGVTSSAIATQAILDAVRVLSGGIPNGNMFAEKLKKSLQTGEAFAGVADLAVVPHPVFEFVRSAKRPAHPYLPNAGSSVAVGVQGNPVVDPSTNTIQGFSTPWAKVISSHYERLPAGLAHVVIPWSTKVGNHVYTGPVMQAMYGCLVYFLNKKYNKITDIGFGQNATASTFDAFHGEDGMRLIAYQNVGAAVDSLLGAINPLKALPAASQKLLDSLNQHVSSNTKFAQEIRDLVAAMDAIRAPLQNASATANAMSRTLMPTDLTDTDLVNKDSSLIAQLNVAELVIKNGQAAGAQLTVGTTDPNAGGNFAAQQTQGNGRTETTISAWASEAAAVVEVLNAFPMRFVCSVKQTEEGLITAAIFSKTFAILLLQRRFLFRGAFPGSASFKTLGDLTANIPIMHSDGVSRVADWGNVLATLARALGFPYGDIPYIKGVLIKD